MAVYAAAIVSGLVVTPVIVHSLGTSTFGLWSFIGSVTIYLSVLDFGVGPSIVRFGAEARGRRATGDLNAIASTGLAVYAAIGLLTLPVGVALAWAVPWIAGAPASEAWDMRVATLLVVPAWRRASRSGSSTACCSGSSATIVEPRQPRLDRRLLRAGRGDPAVATAASSCSAAITLAPPSCAWCLPLFWLRRELPVPEAAARVRQSRAGARAIAFSWHNFLIHITAKVAYSSDVIVVGSSSVRRPPHSTASRRIFALVMGLGTGATTSSSRPSPSSREPRRANGSGTCCSPDSGSEWR